MKNRTKVLVSTAIAVPLVLGGGASAYASYYSDRALPSSSVAGVDVGGMTRDQVTAAVRTRAGKVSLAVTTPDGERSASLADLGYAVDVDATVDKVFAANGDWPSYAQAPFTDRDIEVVATRDVPALDRFVRGLGDASVRAPKNATIALAKDKASFTVTPGVVGRSVDSAQLDRAAAQAARTLTSGAVTVRVVDGPPRVTTATAKEVAAEANALVRHTVEISDGSRTFTASAREKASWVTIPIKDGVPATPVVDRKKVAAWVGEAADEVDTDPVKGLRYLTSTGTKLRDVTQAEDGVEVTNRAAVATELVSALSSGTDAAQRFETKTLEATWTERTLDAGAEKLAYPATPGEKWIDVNLSRHTMTAYLGSKPVFGPVSMVNGAPATPSDTGTFRIFQKNALMTMRGSNADGSDYETPDVPWSSFYNGGEALHGAYWRDSFGYAASHGCINLPISTAKWVFDWAPIGTPVVVHN